MKLFTKFALASVLLDLAWHVFKLVRADQEARMRLAFRERWGASRFGRGVHYIIYTATGSWNINSSAPTSTTFTWGGGGGGGYSGGGNGGRNGN